MVIEIGKLMSMDGNKVERLEVTSSRDLKTPVRDLKIELQKMDPCQTPDLGVFLSQRIFSAQKDDKWLPHDIIEVGGMSWEVKLGLKIF